MNTCIALVDGKGRGVHAARKIRQGEIIERAAVIEFPQEQWQYIEKTVLINYCYFWGKNFKGGAVALGSGSLYNHSFNPNAIYDQFVEEGILEFVALRDIEEGEEITVNYNQKPEDKTPVWFDVIE